MVWAQYNPLTLGIVIPEQDSVEYPFSRYRVAAHTNPNAQAFINGKEVQVYSSGAFVDMIFPSDQITPIEFMVVLDGDTVRQTRYLVKPSRAQEYSSVMVNQKSEEPIKKWFIQPEGDRLNTEQWYGPGDVVPILAQATPAKQLSYSVGEQHTKVIMNERSPGVYEAYHTVDAYDQLFEGPIEFSLKGKWLQRSQATSAETIKVGGLPKIGVVNTPDAYLNIGLGSDRLGGAKYGSIYEGVELKIVGEQIGLYKVELSPSLHAWIPTRFVDLKQSFELPEQALSGNIRIASTNENTEHLQGADIITVSLPKRLPYIVHTELDPNRIIVDIFGTTSNTNWKILLDEATGIDELRWRQMEDERLRLFIDLAHKRHWGYYVEYGWRGQMRIVVKHPPKIDDAQMPLKNRIIAVDAGHGGRSKGALGSTGVMEKEVAEEEERDHKRVEDGQHQSKRRKLQVVAELVEGDERPERVGKDAGEEEGDGGERVGRGRELHRERRVVRFDQVRDLRHQHRRLLVGDALGGALLLEQGSDHLADHDGWVVDG